MFENLRSPILASDNNNVFSRLFKWVLFVYFQNILKYSQTFKHRCTPLASSGPWRSFLKEPNSRHSYTSFIPPLDRFL